MYSTIALAGVDKPRHVDCIQFFFFQAEDGIRDLVRSRGLGDVYKRQFQCRAGRFRQIEKRRVLDFGQQAEGLLRRNLVRVCLLYTSDAADERSSVDLGGRRIIKKKNTMDVRECRMTIQ